MCVMLERGMVKYPEDWSKSWMVNAFKGKGNAVTYDLCKGIRMLEHAEVTDETLNISTFKNRLKTFLFKQSLLDE